MKYQKSPTKKSLKSKKKPGSHKKNLEVTKQSRKSQKWSQRVFQETHGQSVKVYASPRRFFSFLKQGFSCQFLKLYTAVQIWKSQNFPKCQIKAKKTFQKVTEKSEKSKTSEKSQNVHTISKSLQKSLKVKGLLISRRLLLTRVYLCIPLEQQSICHAAREQHSICKALGEQDANCSHRL
jgi:hypothetical protein